MKKKNKAKNDDFPKIDLAELKKEIARNREERFKFVVAYAEWVKRTPNKVWSRQQNEIIGR